MGYNLKNKVVVITGATGGLGRMLSTALVKKGAKLVLIDLDNDTVQKMAAEFDRNAIGFVGDVRNMDQLQAAMDGGAKHFGRLDVVIANAGIEIFYPTMELSEDGFERVIDINLTGVWRTFKAAFPYVKKTRGYLLTISSMAGFVHLPYGSGYSASKAGNYALSNSLRAEMKQFGVGVGSVHPTFFKTPLVDGIHKRAAWGALTDNTTNIISKTTDSEGVCKRIITCIENREETVIVPWNLTLPALFSPALRRVFQWLGPSDENIRKAYDAFQADPKL